MLLLATQAEPQMRAQRHPNLGRLLQPRHYPRAATARSGVPWAADNDAFNGGWDEHAERRFLRMVQALSGLPGCLFVVCPDVVGEAGLTSMLFEEYAPLLWSHGLAPAYVLQEPGVEYDRWWIPWGSLGALFIGGATNQFSSQRQRRSERSSRMVGISPGPRRPSWPGCSSRRQAVSRPRSIPALPPATSVDCSIWDWTSRGSPASWSRRARRPRRAPICARQARHPGPALLETRLKLETGLSAHIKKQLGPEVEQLVAEARARNVWVHMGRVNSLRRLVYAASIGCDSIDGTQWVRFRDT